MNIRRLTAGVAIAIGLGAGAISAFAGEADDAVKARQACMKAHGATFGVLGPMAEGKQAFDKAAIDAAFKAEDAACAGWNGWWDAKFEKGETLETWAKPEIWTDAEGWKAAGGAWYAAAQATRGAADLEAMQATLGALGGSCKGCHEKFRRPKG